MNDGATLEKSMRKLFLRMVLILAPVIFSFCFVLGCGDYDDDDDIGLNDHDGSRPEVLVEAVDRKDDGETERAKVILPSYPFWANDAFQVNLDEIEEMATEYCYENSEPSSEDFFFGWLPMGSFDLFFDTGRSKPENKVLLGNLYVSGYFGGVWLRLALHPEKHGDDFSKDSFDMVRWIFNLLVSFTSQQSEVVETGEDDEVKSAAYSHIFSLIYIYAYNRGYLEQIIEHPPSGSPYLDDWLECEGGQLLDCESAKVDLPFLDRYDVALENLLAPPNPRWQEMALLSQNAEGLIELGANVWQVIDISVLNEKDYRLLVDLSLAFLLASKVSVLGNMTTWADEMPEEGRLSLMVDSGMTLWSGAYLMGFMASTDKDLPELFCPF